VVLDRLDADRSREMRFASAGAADQDDVVRHHLSQLHRREFIEDAQPRSLTSPLDRERIALTQVNRA
jgi:hypothetical protein